MGDLPPSCLGLRPTSAPRPRVCAAGLARRSPSCREWRYSQWVAMSSPPSPVPLPEAVVGLELGPFTAIARIGAGRRTTAYLARIRARDELVTVRVPNEGLDPDAFEAEVK